MNSPQSQQYKVNPVEVMILIISLGILGYSFYRLTQPNAVSFAALSDMKASPVTEDPSRSPASSQSTLSTLNLDCELGSTYKVQSQKVRFSGPLCTDHLLPNPQSPIKSAFVINKSNQYEATVFSNDSEKRFSTDYIPLTGGDNQIHIELTYQNSSIFIQDIVITR